MADQPLLAITETAQQRVRGFLAGAAADRVLSVRVTGSAGGEYTHALSIEPRSRVGPGDAVQREGELVIAVPAQDIAELRGATIDWSEGPQRSGFVVINPNKPPAPIPLPTLPMLAPMGQPVGARPPRAPVGDLDSDIAHRVRAVLDRDVNPSIAAHGGHAELAGIEDRTAYLRLGGGCQGCGMASVTLSQGIEVAITAAVPQISRVVDVTDHASGTNPYFEPAKK